MTDDRPVTCATHGTQRPAYVYQHVVGQINDNVARGLVWECVADGNYFEAFCNDSADLIDRNGGILTEELDLEVGSAVICEGCLNGVLKLNGITRFN